MPSFFIAVAEILARIASISVTLPRPQRPLTNKKSGGSKDTDQSGQSAAATSGAGHDGAADQTTASAAESTSNAKANNLATKPGIVLLI